MTWNDRTKLLIDEEGVNILESLHVLIVGLGGVGGFATECICRAGIGEISIVDFDTVSEDNSNRQVIALQSTIGEKKVEVMRKRLLDINPNLKINAYDIFLSEENIDELINSNHYDYIIDAIDTVKPKLELISKAYHSKINIISSMGAGAKFDPLKIEVKDISKSYKCPLAKRIRHRLRAQGINKGVKVVFSSEDYDTDKFLNTVNARNKKTTVGTISYLPGIFGGICASEVIKDILKK